MSSIQQSRNNSFNGFPNIPPRGTSRDTTTKSLPSQRSFNVTDRIQGESSRRPEMTINTNIDWKEGKAQAPWASPEDLMPQSSGYTPSYARQQRSPLLSELIKRSNATKEKQGSSRGIRVSPKKPSTPTESPFSNLTLPSEPQTSRSNSSGPSKSSKGTPRTPRTPVRGIVRGLSELGKKVLKKKASQPKKIDSPQYTLTRNKYGKIPLLTLGHERYLEVSEPSQSGPLIQARKTLQAFRAAFTRDLPELQFPRGQAQVDMVAGYLMHACPSRLEGSMTTHFVRYSEDSLQAWSSVTNPRDNPSMSTQAKRWNMIEARRRVRHHNKVIEEFNKSWDDWVAEQSREIQTAARRDGEQIQGGTRAPFRDFYHFMLIAADGEIRQLKDIAEALVIQYPNSFPGFM
ncbi:hypothetical protein GGR58DRAFT_513782 [Xylaria digitata]|nr:hypothetical protein GGR58DRAFT_513782 [Xylaria digitata]